MDDDKENVDLNKDKRERSDAQVKEDTEIVFRRNSEESDYLEHICALQEYTEEFFRWYPTSPDPTALMPHITPHVSPSPEPKITWPDIDGDLTLYKEDSSSMIVHKRMIQLKYQAKSFFANPGTLWDSNK